MTTKWLLEAVPYAFDVTCHTFLLQAHVAERENHRRLVRPEDTQQSGRTHQDAGIDFDIICEPSDCKLSPSCRWIDASCVNREGQLAGALLDAMRTIEDTRHSFKSKQLGALRKRLQQTLNACQTHKALPTCNS